MVEMFCSAVQAAPRSLIRTTAVHRSREFRRVPCDVFALHDWLVSNHVYVRKQTDPHTCPFVLTIRLPVRHSGIGSCGGGRVGFADHQ